MPDELDNELDEDPIQLSRALVAESFVDDGID